MGVWFFSITHTVQYTIPINENRLFQVLLNQRREGLQMATEAVWLLVSARQLAPKPVTGSLWVPTVTRLSSQSQRAVRLSHRVSHQALPSLLENPSSQSPWAVKLSQVSVKTLLLVCMQVFVFFGHILLLFFFVSGVLYSLFLATDTDSSLLLSSEMQIFFL